MREDEAAKLIADRVVRIDEWTRQARQAAPAGEKFMEAAPRTDAQLAAEAEKKLFLRLGRKDMDRAGALLALSAGEIPVYMHIPEEKSTRLCPKENWCSADEECLRRLKEALGSENVVLKQKG